MNASRQTRQHVYLSSNFWDGLWIIQQPICNQIQQEEPVLYVERPCSVFTVLRYPRLWRQLFAWLKGARRVTPNLQVLAPLPLFHLGHRLPWLFRTEFLIQQYWIRLWAGRQPNGPRILWVDHPLFSCAIGRCGESLRIYHVGDESAAFPTSHARTIRSLEATLLGKVDLVFAAAEQLARDKRELHPRVYTIWNAIDLRAFFHEPTQPVCEDVAAIPTPRVVFVGVIDRWVDVELLALAATRLPHLHFVLVAPPSAHDKALRTRSNVHFLGRRDRLTIPSILRACSASLIPFRKSALTERLVPLKVFEALAAGIMPVCTDFSVDLDDLERTGHAIIARSADEFIVAIEKAVKADTLAQRDRLARYGRQQNWHARWQQMRAAIGNELSRHDDVGR